MPYFLVNFFLLGPALWLLLRYSGNILLWWRVGSENTNAAENDRMNRNPLILRQTTEKERLHVLQEVDLSVLAAACFISYSDNAFSFLALRPLYSKGNSGCAAFSYRGPFSLTWLSLTYLTQRLEYRFHTARVIGSNPIVGKTGRNPCFCQHDSKHGLAARSKLNDQSIGCFHLWPSSTALTP